MPEQADMLSKRSKRCNKCRKYVVKPELNPIAAQPFKIDLMLLNFCPKVTLIQFVLISKTEGLLFFGLTNTYQSPLKIALKPFPHDDYPDISTNARVLYIYYIYIYIYIGSSRINR